jgi:hypothetical protein
MSRLGTPERDDPRSQKQNWQTGGHIHFRQFLGALWMTGGAGLTRLGSANSFEGLRGLQLAMSSGKPRGSGRYDRFAGFPKDSRAFWRRYDASAGLSLHDAMIFYGPDYEAETVWTLELEGYDGFPPGAEDGWPDPAEEADFRVKSFRLQDRRRLLQHSLMRQLRAGTLIATGYASDAPLDRPAARITPDRWRVLQPDFERSEARGVGLLVVGILVFKAPRQRVQSVKKSPVSTSSSKLRNWYIEWINKNVLQGTTPSREDDLRAARESFHPKVSREQLRALRAELAPESWTRFGRRKRDGFAPK